MKIVATVPNMETDSVRAYHDAALASAAPLPPHSGSDLLALYFNADGTVDVTLALLEPTEEED